MFEISYNLEDKVNEIMLCNEVINQYGIIITNKDVKELIEIHDDTLNDLGRIEVNSTIIEDIIIAFCNSQFINKYNFIDTIGQLVEIFYYYQNGLDGLMSDEDIIRYLYESFEGVVQGSLDYLGDEQLCKLLDDLSNHRDVFEELSYGSI